jgi:superfamily II DNA helicase RecQ
VPFRFFRIAMHDGQGTAEELNAFLRSHRVLQVDRRFVDQGDNSFWAFCIDYQDSKSSGGPAAGPQPAGRGKVDYRALLPPADFAVFARLRDLRKQIATEEAVPVYTIFTNEQLAKMVQTRATSKAALAQIDGVGEARIEKYGPRMLELLSESWERVDAARGAVV